MKRGNQVTIEDEAPKMECVYTLESMEPANTDHKMDLIWELKEKTMTPEISAGFSS